MSPPRRRRRRRTFWTTCRQVWDRLPSATHPGWAIGRLLVLVVVLKLNSTNFDITEGRTILTMIALEALGVKKR